MTEKYGRITFVIEEGLYCCGLGDVGRFEESSPIAPPWNRGPWPTFSSREEQFRDFSARLQQQLEEETEDWNNSNDAFGEDGEKHLYGALNLTLIKGPTPQIPGFVEYLLTDGWKCDQEFRNPKTSNTIVHLSKAL